MNKSKILEFFDAAEIKAPIHIVGCGAIGSHIAEQLTRMGCENIHLWDFDTVEAHNITNQMFIQADVHDSKTCAVQALMYDINPSSINTIKCHNKGWTDEMLNGYVFLCVDNIDLRREIVKANQYNPNCIAFFDFRMRLTDAQHYMAVRSDEVSMNKLFASMDFTHDEAKDATPKSACNVELSVVYTVKCITALGVANFVKLVLERPTKDMILVDLNQFTLDAFPMN